MYVCLNVYNDCVCVNVYNECVYVNVHHDCVCDFDRDKAMCPADHQPITLSPADVHAALSRVNARKLLVLIVSMNASSGPVLSS